MSNTSNFRDAIRDAKTQGLVGLNVIANALPYLKNLRSLRSGECQLAIANCPE